MTQILTKAQATTAGLSTYYTGKLCRNGHLVERYTSCGACTACLKEAQAGVRRALTRTELATPERQSQLEGLVTIRLRATPADEAALLDTAVGLTLSRRPLLNRADVVGAGKGTKPEGGTLLYVVNVDAADVATLRDVQFALLRARGPNIEAERARIFSGLAAQADAARDNGETPWTFK